MKNSKEKLVDIFTKYGISNYKIDYYPKIFGNIVCIFEYKDKEYKFVIDRGEIILNNETIENTNILDSKLLAIDVLVEIIIKILKQ